MQPRTRRTLRPSPALPTDAPDRGANHPTITEEGDLEDGLAVRRWRGASEALRAGGAPWLTQAGAPGEAASMRDQFQCPGGPWS